MTKRKPLSPQTVLAVLTEAGYRCAVPTCRNILAIDLHHLVEISQEGPDEPANLIALCPTCHALFHRGVIKRESIAIWKGMLVALSHAFDTQAIDDLLFLYKLPADFLVSGDGVLKFSRLIAADLATFLRWRWREDGDYTFTYRVLLTQKGRHLVEAWERGDREALKNAIGHIPTPANE
jgi:hypothetical protein